MPTMSPGTFFQTIFNSEHGYVCIATKTTAGWKETFYRYPDNVREMHEYVERNKYLGDMYFCPQLLKEPKRIKQNVSLATCAWADLDSCPPKVMLVRPTISLESSPGRYQAFWVFERAIEPTEAESIARRIAYYHSDEGADKSGWDLTQVLRIPGTRNFKYGQGASAPEVALLEYNASRYRLTDFDKYPQAEGYEYLGIPFPQFIVEPGLVILERFSTRISGAAFTLFLQPPTEETDRSAALFRLEMLCMEAGMDASEVFQVARDSPYNKWQDRQDLLWHDVCRAASMHSSNLKISAPKKLKEAALVTDEDMKQLEKHPGFIERYIDWAKGLGDAAVQYHQGSALIALSSLLAGSIVLPTSFGNLIPNLWVCILADTTITRKSTAMGIAMDLITDIDEQLLMATDGSLEGLTTALSLRPAQVSLFFRDEFTGLLEQMTKKDYMAGMAEFLTNLYDGRTQIRRLRKDEIRVRDPRLVMFVGGIKTRMQSLVTFEHVTSGFLPRFIFITAISDPTKVKPLGPPTERNWGARDSIRQELQEIHSHYDRTTPLLHAGKTIGVQPLITEAQLTPDAWKRFNRIDQTLMQIGIDSGDVKDILTPMYARLAFSILKTAVLIAAARSRESGLLVEEEDIVRAAYYGESWRIYAQDIIANVGKGPLEHKLQLIGRAVQNHGQITRSQIMQRYHLTSTEMTLIAKTLEERGIIFVTQHGRQTVFQSLLTEDEKKLQQLPKSKAKTS